MSQALYRKWRPSVWGDVVGQTHVVETLRNAIAADRVGHAYLFSGPRGTGKTSVARLLAKAVNCLNEDLTKRPDGECDHCRALADGSFLDLIEIDAASNTSVEDVRELRDKINFSPNRGRYKVYIVDEVHMLSAAAFNALLKTLEEPPPHAIFVLATTEVHKIPATVLSRCQRHEFRRLPANEIVAHLKEMAKAEDIQVEDAALQLIARQATGSMRDAQSLLDQLSSLGEQISLDWAQEVLGAATSQSVLDMLDAVTAGDSAAGLEIIQRALDAGSDPRQFARQVVEYLRAVLLLRMGAEVAPELSEEERSKMSQHAETFSVPDLLRIIRLFNHAANEARASWQPSLPLEMAFVEALESETPAAGPAPEPARQQAAPPERKPEAQPAPQDKPASTQSQSGGVSMSGQQWNQLKEAVKAQDQSLAALLNSCRAREIRGNRLYLGFASELLKEKMEKVDNLELVRAALETVLGNRVEIECFVTTNKNNDLPEDVDSNSMVAAAMRLGGEVVDKNDLGRSAD